MNLSDIYPEMKKINRRLGILKILTGDSTIQTMPRGVSFQNTLACNLRCPHCQTHGVEEDRKYNNRIHMPDNLLKTVAHEVLPTADEYLFTVSGEPLAAPRFTQLMQEFLPYDAQVELHTNGTLITPEILTILIPSAKGIHVSIDGATPLILEATRKGAKYQKLMKNILLLTKTTALLPDWLRPTLYFGCTIMGSNIRELPEIVKLAHYLGIDNVYGYFVVIYHAHLENEGVQHHKPLYNAYHKKAVDVANHLGVNLSLPKPFQGIEANPDGSMGGDTMIVKRFPDDYLENLDHDRAVDIDVDMEEIGILADTISKAIIKNLNNRLNRFQDWYLLFHNYRKLIKMRQYYGNLLEKNLMIIKNTIIPKNEPVKYCNSLFERIYVSPNGDITPCCYIYQPLGNVTGQTVSDIWNGPLYKAFIDKFWSNEPLKACIDCHNLSEIKPEKIYNKILWP